MLFFSEENPFLFGQFLKENDPLITGDVPLKIYIMTQKKHSIPTSNQIRAILLSSLSYFSCLYVL